MNKAGIRASGPAAASRMLKVAGRACRRKAMPHSCWSCMREAVGGEATALLGAPVVSRLALLLPAVDLTAARALRTRKAPAVLIVWCGGLLWSGCASG